MINCCDAQVVFGDDNHSTDCEEDEREREIAEWMYERQDEINII